MKKDSTTKQSVKRMSRPSQQEKLTRGFEKISNFWFYKMGLMLN